MIENVHYCVERMDTEPPIFTANVTPEKTHVFIRLNPEEHDDEDGDRGWQCDLCEIAGTDLDIDAIEEDPEGYYQSLKEWAPDPEPDLDDQARRIEALEAALAVLTGGNV